MAGVLVIGLLAIPLAHQIVTTDDHPITLQSLLVVFLPILLGWRVGQHQADPGPAVVVYLIIGGLGAPVFSYGTYGWDRFTGSSGGFLLAFPIAGLLAGYAMEQFQNTKSVLIGALLLFAGQFIILGLGLFWYRAIIPVEESMLASVERLLPGLFIKTAFGGLALVLIQRLVAAALKSRNVEIP